MPFSSDPLFYAEGTIEHGMLDLLSFKKSMFTGVLDGGKEEVFLGGSKLKQFMEIEKSCLFCPFLLLFFFGP